MKKVFVEVFDENFGNFRKTCDDLQLSHILATEWLEDDPEFFDAVTRMDSEGRLLDVAEEQLMLKLNEGNWNAIKFVLETKGQKRGYISRSDGVIRAANVTTVIQFIGKDSGSSNIEIEDREWSEGKI